MDNKSNIAKAFSEKLNKLELQPNESVWKNVSGRIPQKSPSWIAKNGLWVGAAVVLVAAVGIYLNVVVFSPNQTMAEEKSNQISKTEVSAAPEIAQENLPVQNSSEEITQENIPPANPISDKTNLTEDIDIENVASKTSIVLSKEEQSKVTANQKTTELQTTEKTQKNNSIDNNESQLITSHQVSEIQDPIVLKDSTVKFSTNPTVCKGEKVRLSVEGGIFYLWSNGQSLPYIDVVPEMNSTYSVTVTDKFNYAHEHSFYISIDPECTALVIPNAFSPNGDGNNDVFKPEGVNISEFMMQILSRDG
ncbi:MAG: gliding motility-associated C-terminal domain-containing protein, partial [Bacteroidales bacterium]|nr:gliding motility-associated C-terminal domain-containing protein [Bacteroidales bacterium]